MFKTVDRPAGPEGGAYGIGNLYRFQRDTLGFLTDAAQNYGMLSIFGWTKVEGDGSIISVRNITADLRPESRSAICRQLPDI